MDTITVNRVIEEVRKIANERPDFVYADQPLSTPTLQSNSCSYISASYGIPEGEGCIVGQALQKLGISEDALQEHEGYIASGVLIRLDIHDQEESEHTPELEWLDTVQSEQDTKKSWGEAIRVADEALVSQ